MKSFNRKPGLTPKLRFPEFRKEPGWPETLLSNVLTEHQEKSDGASEVHSVSVHKGVVNQIDHLGRSFAAADRSNYNLAKSHDIIYTKSPTGDFPFGIIKQSRLPYNVIVSPLYGVFSPKNRHLGYILDSYFESPVRAKNYLAPITQKGAKNTIQISNKTFLSKGLYLPPSEIEQKKIAACLSSLDELIKAETQKLDSLKAHKKGLMQDLFPREGEPVPKLRFPEFRDAPDWEAAKLGDICDIQRGRFSHRPRNDPKFFGGEYPFIQTGDVVRANGGPVEASQSLNEHGLQVSKLFSPTIVLITIAANIGDTAILDHKACFTDSVAGLIPKNGISPHFVELAMQGKKAYLNKIAPAAAQKNINIEILTDVEILKPDELEQNRIAGCISSLDDQVAAQINRIATLQAHKQGLMQQLFPL